MNRQVPLLSRPLCGLQPPLADLLYLLKTEEPEVVDALYAHADAVRRANVGDEVFLRGLIEVSNHCSRSCTYCGIRSGREIVRYRMTPDEVLACAHRAVELGYGTVVLQAGEDPALTEDFVADLIRRIKAETAVAVTLSLGEREPAELETWRAAGADRYLLRFETASPALFRRIHPGFGEKHDRIALLRQLRSLGYEVGSGMLIGFPGQTWVELAQSVALVGELALDMVGLGPWIPHPDTPLAQHAARLMASPEEQVPHTEALTYRCLALARLLCPRANIPSTTALATIGGAIGRGNGLSRGANIVMPNLTPVQYRRCYEIYPSKGRIEAADEGDSLVRACIASLGRTVGVGRGDARTRLPEVLP